MQDTLKIGKLSLQNVFLLAPLAGYSDYSFRKICRIYGCSLAFTEMISVNGICYSSLNTFKLLNSGHDDRPIGLQLFGSEPERFSEALDKIDYNQFDLIDINCGCPVKKVIKSGSGVALMRDKSRFENIIKTVRKKINLPLTVKIRAGWDSTTINALEIAQIAETNGVDAISIHPRTRSEGFTGPVRYALIKELSDKLSIPVIGNGNLDSPEKTFKIYNESGCKGIMIGRASIGNPWIFKNMIDYFNFGTYEEIPLREKFQIITNHFNEIVKLRGELSGIFSFRKHIVKYLKNYANSSLVKNKLFALKDIEEFKNTLNHYFAQFERLE